MPWPEQTKVESRLEFVVLAREPGANISELCRRFGISRPTGYQWLKRYDEHGFEGLIDRSKRPRSNPLAASGEAVLQILELRQQYGWGPRKLHHVMRSRGELAEVPSIRTIARVLERADVVTRRKRRRSTWSHDSGRPEVAAEAPNDVWTVDFKGWWRTIDGERAEPITVRDHHSRYILDARLMTSVSTAAVQPVFEELFRLYGLPKAIHSDNGSPFACRSARAGLTRLSAWWVSLGITLIRSRPGKPQDNGGHERMHLDLADALERVPADNLEAQQEALTVWRTTFNHIRPHEHLEDETPASRYRRSTRAYKGALPPAYDASFAVRTVTPNGRVKLNGNSYFVSNALAGQRVGLRPGPDGAMRCYFHALDLGTLKVA